MSEFWKDYPTIEAELALVVETLKNGPKTGFASFDESLKGLFDKQGKLLRPALVLSASYLGNDDMRKSQKEKRIALCASIEIFHMATLVHDDIVDEAKLRRGAPSVQSQYGKDYAVYMGDFLLSRSLLMLAQYSVSQHIVTQLAKAIQVICLSEIRQFESRYLLDLSMKHYLKIISGKTAALFAASLATGAYSVEAPDAQVRLMGRIGYALGMCFQIQDDLLDVEGNAATLKKDIFSDLNQGYMTLPILLGLRSDSDGKLRALLLTEQIDKVAIVEILKQRGSIAKSHAMANRYAERALKQIKRLPLGLTRDILEAFIPNILGRRF